MSMWSKRGVGLLAVVVILAFTRWDADAAALTAPTSLSASAVSSSQIKLTWVDTTKTETRFEVWRSLPPSGFELIGTTGKNVTAYSDTTVASDTTYYYEVRATGWKGATSPYSNVASATTPTGDTTPPACSVTINNAAAYATSTAVTLTLSATDAVGVTGYYVSSSSTTPLATAAGWTAVSSTPSYTGTVGYTLSSGNGSKTVYAWFKDAAGNVSATTSDAIGLDQTPPTNGSLTATAGSAQVALGWSGFTDATSGLATANPYSLVYSTGAAPASCATGTPLYTGTATTFTHTSLTNGTTLYYRVCASDKAGNISTGATASATPQAAGGSWEQRFGGTGSDIGRTVAVDSAGNMVVAGRFTSATVDFGGGPLTNLGSASLFLAKYSPAGAHLWSKSFGGAASSVTVQRVAVDGSGNVAVTGSYTGTVNFGGGPLASAGGSDIFLAEYSAAGTHLWSKRLGSSQTDVGTSVAMDGSGNVVLTGWFTGTVDFGGGPLTIDSSIGSALFLAKYSATGTHVWSKIFYSTSGNVGNGVAVDGSGNVLLTGFYQGTVDFGGGPLPLVEQGVFLAKFSAAGAHLWSKSFGSAQDTAGAAVAVDPHGDVVMTGYFTGSMDFGGGLLTSRFGRDVFLAKYSGANGAHLWSREFGGTTNDVVNALAVDGNGDVVLTGSFEYTINFGAATLTSAGLQDIYVANYSGAAGTPLSAESFGSTSTDAGYGVAVDATGAILVTGYFSGTVDFGAGPLPSAGGLDVFLIRLAP